MSDPHEPSDWFDRSVYADVEDEARSHWIHERPPLDRPDPYEYAPCDRCGHYICTEECA